jgi:hypothetical protein
MAAPENPKYTWTVGPDEVDACRREGVLLCAGDRVVGIQGGGMDELTALMLKSVKRGVEDPLVLPPVWRESFVLSNAASRLSRY